MINKPSLEELTKEGANRYELVIATAKCARLVTDEYVEQRADAEKLIERKETDKSISALIDPELRDEKAVRNAVDRLHAGLYAVVHPGEPMPANMIVKTPRVEEEDDRRDEDEDEEN